MRMRSKNGERVIELEPDELRGLVRTIHLCEELRKVVDHPGIETHAKQAVAALYAIAAEYPTKPRKKEEAGKA